MKKTLCATLAGLVVVASLLVVGATSPTTADAVGTTCFEQTISSSTTSAACVTAVQQILNGLDSEWANSGTKPVISPSPLEVTGVYDAATAQAVASLQTAAYHTATGQGLAVTGIVGPDTWNALCEWSLASDTQGGTLVKTGAAAQQEAGCPTYYGTWPVGVSGT